MFTLLHLIVGAAVLATFGCVQCAGRLAAGKCHPICQDPIPIDFEAFARGGSWDVLYITNITDYDDVDEELLTSTPIVEGIFRLDDRVVFGDESSNRSTYIMSYVDNVIIEDGVDDKGNQHDYRSYPLAQTAEFCVLIYRCSDAGQENFDLRLIIAPNGVECSIEGVKYLFAVDKKCNFNGELKKLPKRHIK